MLAASTNNIIGSPFVKLNLVDSTNNYAMAQIKNGVAQHGITYFAQEQTAGKGQRNKHWLSAKGENIILSVVLAFKHFPVYHKFFLNIIAALAVFNLFNKYTTKNIKVKWTNDIYWCDRKAGGILIENIILGEECKYSVIGFGVNINQTAFDASLKNPVSLKQITGINFNVVNLSHELCAMLQEKFMQLLNADFKALLNEYNDNLYKKNAVVKFKKGTRIFDGRVIAVDETGRLIVESMGEESFEFGAVEWII